MIRASFTDEIRDVLGRVSEKLGVYVSDGNVEQAIAAMNAYIPDIIAEESIAKKTKDVVAKAPAIPTPKKEKIIRYYGIVLE